MTRSSGFTLVEMSIVLVIIGFVVGGTVLTQTLIRQSQLRTVVSEYDLYGKATQEFIDKYSALPGDMPTAQTQWGSLLANQCTGMTAITTITTSNTATCNGDGNGKIDQNGTSVEYYAVWQHLSNAGLIDGRFTGAVYSTSVPTSKAGYNIPTTRIGGAGWTMTYFGTVGTTANYYGDSYGHVLMLGAPSGTNYQYGAILTASELYQLDKKLDDGAPGTGKLRTWRTGYLPNCTTNDSSQSAQTFNVTNKDLTCSLVFLMGI